MNFLPRRSAAGAAAALFAAPATTVELLFPRRARAQSAPAQQAPVQARLPYVMVLNSRDANVSLIDQATFKEVARVDVGKEPHHLYPTPDNRTLIVANAVSNDLHFLDPETGAVRGRLRNIDDPYQLAFSPDNRWFVTAALRLDRVDVYAWDGRTKTLARQIRLPKAPSHVWFSADSRFVYVSLQDSDQIAAIEVATQSVAWTLPVGRQPAGLVITPDGRHLLVGVMGRDFVEVIDLQARRSVARIRTGRGAHNFRGMGDKRHMLVTNRVENTVSIIDMDAMKVVGDIAVPGGPDCMELTADGRLLWVTSRFAKQVSVVDMAQRKVVRTIAVGRSPHGIYLHNRAPLL
jgi:YVTN family beta-propeller protein